MSAALLYLDSSAIVKLIRTEPETLALIEFLRDRPLRLSSALAQAEVLRAVRRAGLDSAEHRRAQDVLRHIALRRIDETVLGGAAHLDPPELRTLDAIHLATALSLGADLAAVVTYDMRLAEEAQHAGLRVFAPT